MKTYTQPSAKEKHKMQTFLNSLDLPAIGENRKSK
jgi:hypothetical protein